MENIRETVCWRLRGKARWRWRKDARRELRAGVVGRPWTYREFRQLKQVSRIVERSELSNELYKYSTKKFPIRAEVLANGKVG